MGHTDDLSDFQRNLFQEIGGAALMGEPIKSPESYGRALGASALDVRDAMAALEQRGHIIIEHGSGARLGEYRATAHVNGTFLTQWGGLE